MRRASAPAAAPSVAPPERPERPLDGARATRPGRAPTSMVVFLVWVITGVGLAPAAKGQSRDEVDAARADADAAAAVLQSATDELIASQFRELNVERGLLDALTAFDRASRDLTGAGHSILAIRGELDQRTEDVGHLRDAVNEAAIAAYKSAALGLGSVWMADSYLGATVAGEALDGPVDLAVSRMRSLEARRRELGVVRSELVNRQSTLRELREQHAQAREQLERALGVASEIVTAALDRVGRADAEYRTALDRVAEEERRLAAIAGVEHWRGLVERYFPPERVGEALQVMRCESRGNPDATNAVSDAAGLFQFLEATWAFASARAGFEGSSRYEPEANVAAAAWLVRHSIDVGHPGGAWGHWTCQPGS